MENCKQFVEEYLALCEKHDIRIVDREDMCRELDLEVHSSHYKNEYNKKLRKRATKPPFNIYAEMC